ncbi:MAG: peptidylprolyl isomerase [Chloroflexi bacterium]|nr:peptidylprolyl isomerase [Chloroflexota bacterium]
MSSQVVIQTEIGDLVVALDAARAPITVANFLRYVDAGRYRDAMFYRVVRMDNQPNDAVKIEVIQGGLGMGEHPNKLPPIPQETTRITGIRHSDGVISMARLAPDSAHSEFFICIGDQPELDFGGARNPDGQGFAAFGRVVSGMDVARTIQQLPADGQMLKQKISILGVSRIER